MNTAEMHPRNALDSAQALADFLVSCVGAMGGSDAGVWPCGDGWRGMYIVTELLVDLLKRAGDPG